MVEYSDKTIAYTPAFVALGVGVTGALFLSQCIYWSKRTKSAEGWFYKVQGDWSKETGLTRTEQQTAREKLKKLGVLLEKKMGVPCKVFYSVNTDKLNHILINGIPEKTKNSEKKPTEKKRVKATKKSDTKNAETLQTSLQESCKLERRNPASSTAETLQTSLQESCKLERRNPASSTAGILQTNTESTNESTTENTTENTYKKICIEPEGSQPAIKIPTNKFNTAGEEYLVTKKQIQEFRELYPAIDVMQSLRDIRGWNLSNPSKRKTMSGMASHINRWLAKDQNKGNHKPTRHAENFNGGRHDTGKKLFEHDDDWLEGIGGSAAIFAERVSEQPGGDQTCVENFGVGGFIDMEAGVPTANASIDEGEWY